MTPDATDKALLAAIEDGLPLDPSPYEKVAEGLGISEAEVIERLTRLRDGGTVKRMGLVVRHHELGYCANAMTVWNVPDDRVAEFGRRVAAFDFVTLCYRRARQEPRWPYNLYCMIHGKDADQVRGQIAEINRETGLEAYPSAVLFSKRRFKQCGARYGGRRARKEGADVIPLDPTDRRIVNEFQGGFPVSDRPFTESGERLGISETEMIERVSALCDNGVLSRFGPMYNAEELGGAVTLAAMAVPSERFDEVADRVNAHTEVAHNYARDHELNMWFVLSVETPERIDQVIGEIEAETGIPVHAMPKLEEFYVGLRISV